MVNIKTAAWVTIILVIISLVVISAHFSSTMLEYSRYNNQWNGTSAYYTSLEDSGVTDIRDYSDLKTCEDALLLIIAPDADFSGEEIEECNSFLKRGNTIFIADEQGIANPLLKGIGSEITIRPGDLCSVDLEYNDPHSTICYVVANDTILDSVSTILLNRPAALDGGQPLVSSSLISWIDKNEDAKVNLNETMNRFTVLSRDVKHGGTIYVLSDPSIFINGMIFARGNRDNLRLIDNLNLPHSNLLIDQVHGGTASEDGILLFINVIKTTMFIKILIISMVLFAILFAYVWRYF